MYSYDAPPQCWFTRHVDGRVTVNDWVRWQWFTKDFLAYASPCTVSYEPESRLLTITVDNGRAVYRLEEEDANGLLRGEVIESEWAGVVLD